jgi:hypothetical protein
MFALMSGKRKSDYKAVLKKLKEVLGAVRVRRIVVDYEMALWKTFPKVFEGIEVKGCLFHWTQALWRKVQELGLQTAYMQDKDIFAFVKQLMALPFLPSGVIPTIFEDLKSKASSRELQLLVNYIRNTWIESAVWCPESWSIYMSPIRTNNDIEGWHNAINRRAGGRCALPLYQLINLLHAEARLMEMQVRLVSDGKLTRVQRVKYVKMQKKIFDLWDSFNEGKKNAQQLLKACSHLNGPVN